MKLKSLLAATAALGLLATASFADAIMIKDPYARSSTSMSKSGAAFMTIMNHSDQNDRVVGAATDAAAKVELHTHKEDANGVMKMVEVEEGFPVAAGEMIQLKRGGDHVMLMGLTAPLEQGDMITLTLTFEKAGDVVVEVPVDLNRKPAHGEMDHGKMDHGKMKHSDH